jgi:pilus assembly protein CpaC
MKKIFISFALFGLATLLSVHGALAQTSKSEVVVPLNRSELMTLPEDVSEVAIADPNIADVVVHGSTRVSVVGKKIGRTSLRIFNEEGQLIKDTEVLVSYDLPAIRRALKNFFPHERIGVELVNDNVAITGSITDAETAQRAVRIVEEFMDDRSRTTLTGDSNVINLANIRSGQQVMLRVRIGEMQRTTAKRLGIDLSVAQNMGNFVFGLGQGVVGGSSALFAQDAAGIAGQFGRFGAGFNAGGTGLAAVLDALENEGLFKLMAEPNLVALSGERAEFLSGGEFPIEVAQGNGAVGVQFREYGIGVQFTPIVLSETRLRLIVQPEVSELDFSVATEDGTPGLLSRRARTTVELAPGESFMIAGLIQDNVESTIREVPGIAEVPVLSALFRNSSYDRDERELVIAVTPYLVDPVAGTDIKTPADDFRSASLMESFFYGSMGSLQGDVLRISQTPAVEGPIGFMVD